MALVECINRMRSICSRNGSQDSVLLRFICVRKYFLILFFIFPFVAKADSLPWKIVPAESSIKFTIIQNDAPISGNFKTFTGDIDADPQKLATSHIRIVVDMNSVATSYTEVADTLKTSAWFNVKIFPQAIFISNKLVKTGDKTYQADGTLTIRDKTLPVVLNFTLEDYSDHKAKVQGSTMFKRSEFGLASGDWAKTDSLKDDVKVDFVLTTVR